MPHGTNTLSETKTLSFYDKTTHVVDLGAAQKEFSKLAKGKAHRSPDIFDKGTSRAAIFKNVFFNSAQRGATLGAQVGIATMTLPDYITGTGVSRPGNRAKDSEQFKDEGVVGNIVKLGGAGVSGVAELAGNVMGGIVGVISIPINAATGTKNHDAFVKTAVSTGGKLTGLTTAAIVAGAGGTSTTLSRLPSVVVKGLFSGIGGFCGGCMGLVRASYRALNGA